MELYRFDAMVGQEVGEYGSVNLILTRIARELVGVSIVSMQFEPKGEVGYHHAATNQLFMIVSGEGWVSGEEQQPVPIYTGQAAFWNTGEWHAAGSQKGMSAIVIEADNLEADKTMLLLEKV